MAEHAMSYLVIVHLFGAMPFGSPSVVASFTSSCQGWTLGAVDLGVAKASGSNSNGDLIFRDERYIGYCVAFPK